MDVSEQSYEELLKRLSRLIAKRKINAGDIIGVFDGLKFKIPKLIIDNIYKQYKSELNPEEAQALFSELIEVAKQKTEQDSDKVNITVKETLSEYTAYNRFLTQDPEGQSILLDYIDSEIELAAITNDYISAVREGTTVDRDFEEFTKWAKEWLNDVKNNKLKFLKSSAAQKFGETIFGKVNGLIKTILVGDIKN